MTFSEIAGLLPLIPVIHILGLLHAFHALMYVRSSQGAIAWTISLTTFPLLAMPLYWVFGRARFHGYVEARRSGKLRINHLAQYVLQRIEPFHATFEGYRKMQARMSERLAALPFTNNNSVDLLIDGEATFSRIFDAIDSAKHYILVQFFIFHDDRLGKELKSRLIGKAREGVRIHLLYDEIGSHDLPSSYVSELRTEGIEAIPFKTTRGKGNRFQINFRNHRKIVVVDGRTAFIGGLNVGDEYMGRSSKFGPWRDTHARIVGPAVQCVQLAFIEDWFWACKRIPQLEWTPQPAPPPGMQVLIMPTGPADEMYTCNLMFVQAINSARKRLWITSPYFVPDESVTAALQVAALRGVDVRIILPLKPDHILVYLSAFAYFEDMHKAGVKLYRYTQGFMHQKVMLVDDNMATVGTVNMDNRSFRLNFEMTAIVADKKFAASVEKMLTADLERSQAVQPEHYRDRPIWFTIATRIAHLMAPVQ